MTGGTLPDRCRLLLPADRSLRRTGLRGHPGRRDLPTVAPVVAFDTEAEAIELANRTEYGLVAYVYTGDLARGLRVSEALESGMVGLNRALVSDPVQW